MSDTKNISEVTAIATEEFSNASIAVIKQLQAKVAKLESENESLLQMLEQNTPALIQTSDLTLGISNEQLICETQILLLKNKAVTNAPLTMEEVKKFQILTEVLQKYKVVKPSDEELAIKQLTPEQLMAQALAPEVV